MLVAEEGMIILNYTEEHSPTQLLSYYNYGDLVHWDTKREKLVAFAEDEFVDAERWLALSRQPPRPLTSTLALASSSAPRLLSPLSYAETPRRSRPTLYLLCPLASAFVSYSYEDQEFVLVLVQHL